MEEKKKQKFKEFLRVMGVESNKAAGKQTWNDSFNDFVGDYTSKERKQVRIEAERKKKH